MSLEDDDAALRERVLTAFVDAEPLTVEEVALATCVPEPAAADALADLVEAGELERSRVRGVDIRQRKDAERADVDLEAPVDLYHRSGEDVLDDVGTRDARRVEGATGDADDDGEDAADPRDRRLARMDVGGASEMMRDWRRDAVRAAHDYLRERGPCDPEELQSEVYPAHEAGFDDVEAWWACVRPRLARLPGVEIDDGRWTVAE